ncbi:MAG: thioredoxin domain-containing protein [Gemmatimonadota bacterium]
MNREKSGGSRGRAANLLTWLLLGSSGVVLGGRTGVLPVVRWTGEWRSWLAHRRALAVLPDLYHAHPSIGNILARDSAVMFTDYECPYCARQESLLASSPEMGLKLRITYVNLPLTEIHAAAMKGARVAYCASGVSDFPRVHSALFASSRWKQSATFGDWLTAAEPAPDQRRAILNCMESDSSRLAVVRDQEIARRIGLSATPTWIISGRLISGVLSADALLQLTRDSSTALLSDLDIH